MLYDGNKETWIMTRNAFGAKAANVSTQKITLAGGSAKALAEQVLRIWKNLTQKIDHHKRLKDEIEKQILQTILVCYLNSPGQEIFLTKISLEIRFLSKCKGPLTKKIYNFFVKNQQSLQALKKYYQDFEDNIKDLSNWTFQQHQRLAPLLKTHKVTISSHQSLIVPATLLCFVRNLFETHTKIAALALNPEQTISVTRRVQSIFVGTEAEKLPPSKNGICFELNEIADIKPVEHKIGLGSECYVSRLFMDFLDEPQLTLIFFRNADLSMLPDSLQSHFQKIWIQFMSDWGHLAPTVKDEIKALALRNKPSSAVCMLKKDVAVSEQLKYEVLERIGNPWHCPKDGIQEFRSQFIQMAVINYMRYYFKNTCRQFIFDAIKRPLYVVQIGGRSLCLGQDKDNIFAFVQSSFLQWAINNPAAFKEQLQSCQNSPFRSFIQSAFNNCTQSIHWALKENLKEIEDASKDKISQLHPFTVLPQEILEDLSRLSGCGKNEIQDQWAYKLLELMVIINQATSVDIARSHILTNEAFKAFRLSISALEIKFWFSPDLSELKILPLFEFFSPADDLQKVNYVEYMRDRVPLIRILSYIHVPNLSKPGSYTSRIYDGIAFNWRAPDKLIQFIASKASTS